jgi:hypothetical protein
MTKATCKIEDCTDPVSGRGWCSMHWQRWKNNGDPLVVKRRAKQAAVCERDDCGEPGYMRGLCMPHYRKVQKAERGPCTVEGCGEPWSARGLCDVHYSRFMRTKSTDDPKAADRPCSVDGCENQVRAREWCQKHYGNWRKHGTPIAPPKPEKVWLPCSREDCTKLAARKNGMCDRHYRESIVDGKPKCRAAGCSKPVRVRDNFCKSHGGWGGQLYVKYGISGEQWQALHEAQGGLCAICRRPPEVSKRVVRLVVDHDHACCPGTKSCGKCVRGLLCIWCNRLLGMALDEPDRLHAAIKYLEGRAVKGQLTPFAA